MVKSRELHCIINGVTRKFERKPHRRNIGIDLPLGANVIFYLIDKNARGSSKKGEMLEVLVPKTINPPPPESPLVLAVELLQNVNN